ncbi:Hsp20/alpha crystallin family protein [Achromobacter sp. HZ34]|nr:Hsp20/alpha crystallin family protein [Achromobacter sp. HZ34]OWT74693.1 heat-shock protein Hsp20 [Achromobacter sp. HZ34]OWT79160.1 heat-shock protein Hsp20 [Achromobacter sp. HZ28]
MSRLIRYSPFSAEPFADAFEGFLRPIRGIVEDRAHMDIDLSETASEYVVQAEIPGVDKADISVDIDGSTIRISAKKSSEHKIEKDGEVLRSERYWGELQRALTLASAVDEEKATASYENGVLRLTLPKRAGEAKRRLTIA